MNQGKGVFVSSRAAEPVGPYPHARKVGNLIFVSGIGPRKRGAKEIPVGIEAQCRSMFQNIRYILEDAGSTWDNIVDITVFLTNMDDFAAYNRVYAEYFTKNQPARTTVEVTRLPTAISVEAKCIATASQAD